MIKNILITGGAGFIGSHLADELIAQGYKVRALDNLSEQVHGPNAKRPEYLHRDVELVVGDVRDKAAVKKALQDIDAVFHFAAMVGVGQSMYQIKNYTDVNNLGTAVLLEALIESPVKKLVVASSMSIYGEGLYKTATGQCIEECERNLEDLKKQRWELYDGEKNPLMPIATPEHKKPCLSSVYALSKYDQERLCLITGKAYNIPTTALRFFNVYGTRQALSNPYTGVLAIFASRLLNDNAPLIFEDGMQKRDFVHVKDVARACRFALEKQASSGEVINVGSGNQYSIYEIAENLARVMNKEIKAQVTGKYRVGDIRHCFADLTKAKLLLEYEPCIKFDEGLAELSQWLKGQIAIDHVSKATSELASRGLTV
ncbi:NAD-dependent epimerase/dehydratase family protein [Legionella jordanis]|uniref:NAD dependent epimerase/dehydratase family protein n=1 Tax=Legionella jordanis TaxID=456 RepID=A0A0W0VG41_9GAMM|nr:SDR family NAD(P)-dependent oxidoreductase [Legionella jordanis]KTD19058.1 NAD dependent epimerase/dehydratase family protein [Legionella jordanis]RMX05389.1 SDR family NAD(P)-dependent oxidoreductase [Legionella jordanis]VEH13161.1 NAD dependent epimerase/dehydratase family protein [Legionella jordanis]HAT8714818.1 SDR family NAD(P)-dependent oxidoreductase [Legionella jordanis]